MALLEVMLLLEDLNSTRIADPSMPTWHEHPIRESAEANNAVSDVDSTDRIV